ncbi:hypothetical protein BJ981_002836 [Sphaerisporangium krabiense]|uniref:Uncharacterized protein n=1 Tax=Sphaerisporangium krabiense TaxID=763782 RepID=A0A7W8Z4B6_9ACTN|nr:hypothetical protein [Sphaerisporangium krabiense]
MERTVGGLCGARAGEAIDQICGRDAPSLLGPARPAG